MKKGLRRGRATTKTETDIDSERSPDEEGVETCSTTPVRPAAPRASERSPDEEGVETV